MNSVLWLLPISTSFNHLNQMQVVSHWVGYPMPLPVVKLVLMCKATEMLSKLHVYKIWSRSSVPKHNLHYYKRFWFQGIPPSVHEPFIYNIELFSGISISIIDYHRLNILSFFLEIKYIWNEGSSADSLSGRGLYR